MIATTKILDETDRRIIEKVSEGMAYKEIASHLRITIPHIKYRIKIMKKEYRCNSLTSLVLKIKD